MPEEVRRGIAEYKERQMDKRKREREERLGIVPTFEDDLGGGGKKRKLGNGKINNKEDAKEEEERRAEEAKRRRPFKVPTEGESFVLGGYWRILWARRKGSCGGLGKEQSIQVV